MSTFLVLLTTTVVSIVLTGFTFSLRQRRRFEAAGGTFACRMRLVAGSPPDWPSGRRDRGRGCGLWVHDVLLVQRGRWRPRLVALRVRLPEDSIRAVAPREFRGLGSDPVAIDLRLDDGAIVRVAAPTGTGTSWPDRSWPLPSPLCRPGPGEAMRAVSMKCARSGSTPKTERSEWCADAWCPTEPPTMAAWPGRASRLGICICASKARPRGFSRSP